MRKPRFRRSLREILSAVLRLASRDEEADFFASLSDVEMDRWLFRTAVHEAGHAVVAIKTGLGLRSVSIVPRSYKGIVFLGVTNIPPSDLSLLSRIAGKGESAALPLTAFLLAGSLSEEWLGGRRLAEAGSLVDYRCASHGAGGGVVRSSASIESPANEQDARDRSCGQECHDRGAHGPIRMRTDRSTNRNRAHQRAASYRRRGHRDHGRTRQEGKNEQAVAATFRECGGRQVRPKTRRRGQEIASRKATGLSND